MMQPPKTNEPKKKKKDDASSFLGKFFGDILGAFSWAIWILWSRDIATTEYGLSKCVINSNTVLHEVYKKKQKKQHWTINADFCLFSL